MGYLGAEGWFHFFLILEFCKFVFVNGSESVVTFCRWKGLLERQISGRRSRDAT